MSTELPQFPYHPDPVATGTVESSADECIACEQARGYIYNGPVYAIEEYDGVFCPWCIADGSAAKKFDATFTDDSDVPDGVPTHVVEAIVERTPSFYSWQQDHWLYHCNDGAAFLGPVGSPAIYEYPGAVNAIRTEGSENGWTDSEINEYLDSLDAHGEPCAYLFRCRHCGTHLAYSDLG